MKLSFKFIAILLTISLLQGCQGGMNKQTGGTLLGGATGAWLGSRLGGGKGTIATTAVGALAGAFIGSQIGKDMDDKDRQIAELTSQKALEAAPTGSNVQWRNPDNGHTGVVTPTKTFQNERGENCREYTHTVVIGGKQEKAYGKACRQPNGYWKIAG